MICGIDPGLSGGIAMLESGNARVWRMPIINHPRGRGHAYDLDAMRQALKANNPMHVFIEEYRAFAPKGKRIGANSVRMGERGVALWEGMCAAMQIPLTIISPRTWQKVMLAGVAKGDTKAASIYRAKQLYPGVDLRPGQCRKDQDGLSDALLIAVYGLRQLKGNDNDPT